MRVHIKPLRQEGTYLAALRKDGWDVLPDGNGDLHAVHPDINSEDAARARLYLLGMLTARTLRIEFLHSGEAGPDGELP